MPINESSGIRRSNLTRQQRLEAEAALYGYNMTEEAKPLTQEEIERMRAIVSQHDRDAGIKEWDLNHPPQEPYSYKPFPKMLYNHETKKTMVVASQEDMDKKAKDGFDAKPFPPEPVPPHEYEMILGADHLPQGSVTDRDAAPKHEKQPPPPNDKKGK